MLNFVDISKNKAFQEQNGYSQLGCQIALSERPIDFQYESSEIITSFEAKKLDYNGNIIDTIVIEPSLIQIVNGYHYCDGMVKYTNPLSCGSYFFIINEKYQSETFKIFDGFEDAYAGIDSSISVSGLYFYDSTKDNSSLDKIGAPVLSFAKEYGTNIQPLAFQYKSKESITSVQLIELDIQKNELQTIDLDIAIVSADGNYHICTGENIYSNFIECGIYYFVINGKYKSKVFSIFELVCPVIENETITGNLISGQTINFAFDAYITGANAGVEVYFTFIFSNGIDSFSETYNLLPTVQNFNFDIVIPESSSGFATITVLNNLCVNSKVVTYSIEAVPETENMMYWMDGSPLLWLDNDNIFWL